jgi:hypothetical protein
MGTFMGMQVFIGNNPTDEARDSGFEMHNLVGELTTFFSFFIRFIHQDFQAFPTTLSLPSALNTHVEVTDLVFRDGSGKDDPELDQLHADWSGYEKLNQTVKRLRWVAV